MTDARLHTKTETVLELERENAAADRALDDMNERIKAAERKLAERDAGAVPPGSRR